MIDKFKKFIQEEIYNQLRYYNIGRHEIKKCKITCFHLTAYDDDFEYVKRRICYFISSWIGPIYVNMYPDRYYIIVEIREDIT